MEASNLQIYWHESQPVYSLCFPPSSKYDPQLPKLFTSGGDNKVRIWNLNTIKSTANESCFKIDTIDFLTSLQQHEQAINVIRFNSRGDILASAGDDGQILLWKRNLDGQSTRETPFGFTTDEESQNENNNKDKNKDKDNHSNNNNNHVDGKSIKEENKESWYVWKRLRFHSHAPEIYDLVWSPCDNYILCGCMDNFIRVFQIHNNSNKDDDNDDPRCIFSLKEHNHYVQGVTWDPQNKYILSQSTDRSINVYKLIFDHGNKQLLDIQLQNRIIKLDKSYMFHNETLPSFFRRLTMSPCGNLILVPTGISKNNNDITSSLSPTTSIITTTTNNNNNNNNNNNSTEGTNCVYIFARSTLKDNLNRPIMKISNLKKPALIISFNPNFYKIESTTMSEFISLPYKLIFAIATSNEILIYDTIKIEPLAIIGNLHYTPITDLTWSPDGKFLMISSTDGFCSYISIDDNNLFGQRLNNDEIMKFKNVPSVSVSNNVTIENKPKHDIINILPVKKKIKPSNKQTNPTT